jgi:hypothetical protein
MMSACEIVFLGVAYLSYDIAQCEAVKAFEYVILPLRRNPGSVISISAVNKYSSFKRATSIT